MWYDKLSVCDLVRVDSDSWQASDSSVCSGNKDVFVVNLMLYNPQTIRFARLGKWCYESNVVKRLTNQNRVICLFDMIGRSDTLSFYGTEKKYMLRAQRTVRNEEDKTSFSLGRSAESSVASLLSDQLV